MQFRLDIARPIETLGPLEAALRAIDPAALLDLGPDGATVRVASVLGADELCQLATDAGFPVERSRIVGVRSDCCGGCAG